MKAKDLDSTPITFTDEEALGCKKSIESLQRLLTDAQREERGLPTGLHRGTARTKKSAQDILCIIYIICIIICIICIIYIICIICIICILCIFIWLILKTFLWRSRKRKNVTEKTPLATKSEKEA